MADWSWPDGKRLAVSIVVNVEEGSEYSLAEGDPITEPVDELGVSLKKPIRNYGNESNYRYGLGPGFRRIVALLDEYNIPATFTAAALSLERAPHIARYIADGPHEPCSHGWRWIHQFRLDEDAEREFILKAADSIEASTGKRPVGWLSRYLHTENTRRLLTETGFRYHMDDYSDDSPFIDASHQRPIVILPYALDSNDMKFWIDPSLTPDQWLKYAVDTFNWLYEETAPQPQYMSLGLHLRIIGRPGRIAALQAFLRHVRSHKDVWIATRAQIAAHYASAQGLEQ
ncbi:MAG: polysaccharide deacetylase family protein [Wenzhouxiangella sp.]|nr:polysaccharide deacetylase family protein [Wenzhouxiangella sp.]MCH8479066.1 polysaccharide deacetylase family protein [Wenzhouxiangella sp.]